MAEVFGYDITCDPGDLYNRKCYVNVHTPPGCDASDPACVITQQEIIGYNNGDPISKAPSQSSWMAWIPSLTTLNQSGIAYQPYGQTGMPYTPYGIVGTGGAFRSYSSQRQQQSQAGGQAGAVQPSTTVISTAIALTAATGVILGVKWFEAR